MLKIRDYLEGLCYNVAFSRINGYGANHSNLIGKFCLWFVFKFFDLAAWLHGPSRIPDGFVVPTFEDFDF